MRIRNWIGLAVALVTMTGLSAQEFGMSIFNSANHSAVHLAGTTAVNGAIDASARRAARSGPGVAGRSTPGATASRYEVVPAATELLRFRSSNRVTQVVHQDLVDTLAPALAAGYRPEDLQQVLAGGELQRGFANALRDYGYSERDLGDVLTGVLVLNWQVANATADLSAQQRRGVDVLREGVRSALLGSDWLPRLHDADKQQIAETLALSSMLIAVRYQDAVRRGDRAAADLSSRDARDLIREATGSDLRGLILTGNGLQSR